MQDTLHHGVKQQAEVIIVSQYPVLNTSHSVSIEDLPLIVFHNIDPMKKSINKDSLRRHICKDLNVTPEGDCINYVVGQKPYNPTTIVQQLDFAFQKSHGEEIILMEHDCLYPEKYIPIVHEMLKDYEMTRVAFNRCYLTTQGFLKFMALYLSGMAFRRNIFGEYIAEKKRQLITKQRIDYLEPYMSDMKATPDEFRIEKWIAIDSYLGKDQDILDIQHGLNYSQCLHVGTSIFNHAFQTHPYWGEYQSYSQLFPQLTKSEKVLCFSGIQELEI
ncbi:MAG: hypothetical protein WC375_00185 [Methanomassiliicoccales archaeon]